MIGVGECDRDLTLRADLSGERSVRIMKVGSPLGDRERVGDRERLDKAEEGRTSICCGPGGMGGAG